MIKWIATFILIWFIYEVRAVFPPMIVGAIIAYLLLPLVQHLAARAKISIGMSTAIVYLGALSILGLTIWGLGPSIFHEITELATKQHDIVLNVVQQFKDMTHWEGDASATTDQVLTNIHETFGKPSELAHIGGLVSHGFLAILVCFVSSIYLTVDSENVGRFFLQYLPPDRRNQAVLLSGQMNRLLSNYVRGQLLLITLMSAVAWVFLSLIMHMRYALPVAIISGFLEIIPVLGPILAISTATLVGIWQFGPNAAAIIILFYTIARWIEDYIVVPKVIGHAVELHPLAVIFAVLCGEHLAGALGMLIAIPVAACIKLSIDFFYFGKIPADPQHPNQTELVEPGQSQTQEQAPAEQAKETVSITAGEGHDEIGAILTAESKEKI